jgi:hypothetical protein
MAHGEAVKALLDSARQSDEWAARESERPSVRFAMYERARLLEWAADLLDDSLPLSPLLTRDVLPDEVDEDPKCGSSGPDLWAAYKEGQAQHPHHGCVVYQDIADTLGLRAAWELGAASAVVPEDGPSWGEAVKAARERADYVRKHGPLSIAFEWEYVANYLESLHSETDEQRAKRMLGEWLSGSRCRTWDMSNQTVQNGFWVVELWNDSLNPVSDPDYHAEGPSMALAIIAAVEKARKVEQ